VRATALTTIIISRDIGKIARGTVAAAVGMIDYDLQDSKTPKVSGTVSGA